MFDQIGGDHNNKIKNVYVWKTCNFYNNLRGSKPVIAAKLFLLGDGYVSIEEFEEQMEEERRKRGFAKYVKTY